MSPKKKVVNPIVPAEQPQVSGGIPLQEIEYRTVVAGGVAQVRAIQRYRNDVSQSVEAVYVFPLPDEASVTGCRMVIGDRKIAAVLKEREIARQEYQAAIDAGHHGALMEQERPNIFTMNVGGIEPGESVEVEVDYIQRVPWQTGGGRFVIPLVVAPRFIHGKPTGKSSGGWSPDTDEVPDASRITPVVAKEGVQYTATVKVSFSPGFRCRLTSPSHPDLISEQTVGKSATVEVLSGAIRTDRDFILAYESLAKIPQVAVHTGEFGDEKFTLVSIFPPGEVAIQPKDVVFAADISGSMSGPKITGLKTLLEKELRKLKDQNIGHRAGVLLFNFSNKWLFPLGEITDEKISLVRTIDAQGGTMLGRALTEAHQALSDSGRQRVIVLITDGQTSDLNYIGTGVPIINAGIDSAINDSGLKEIARRSGGVYLSFLPGEDFDRAANTVLGMVSGPVLREITVQGEGEIVGIQDVFKGMPAAIAIRHGGNFPKEIRIEGKDPTGNAVNWIVKTGDASECEFASQVWAREIIRENPDKDQQVATSLKYGVICSQTSFVAVSEKEVPGQKPIRVEIPVNLPHTWDYDEVFGSAVLGFSAGLSSPGFHSLTGRGGRVRGLVGGRDEELYSYGGAAKCFFGAAVEVDDIEIRKPRKPIIEEIVMPQKPAVASANGRFALDSADPVNQLVAILIAVQQGKTGEAESAIGKLNAELTLAVVKKWSEGKRAMAFYFACRLAAYGLRIKAEVIKAISGEPKSPEAKAWYCFAERERGRQPQAVAPAPGSDGCDYLAWKMGQSQRPQSGDWSLVP
jgi:Ca-activated chloride channel homolog